MPDEASAVPRTAHLERLIRDLYLERRLSDREVAEVLGVNRVTVTRWRIRWGIFRADRPPVVIADPEGTP